MIRSVQIKALKSIQELTVPCSRLNILCGTNSSGKSTFLQALLLIKQSVDLNQGLNGDLVSLGDFRLDAKNYRSSEDGIFVEVQGDGFFEAPVTFIAHEDGWINDLHNYKRFVRQTKSPYNGAAENCAGLVSRIPMRYLSCNRIGAQDLYPKNYRQEADIGVNGEYALHYLQLHGNTPLEEALVEDPSSTTLLTQVNYWLYKIVGAVISVEDVPGTDVIKGAFDAGAGRDVRPRNVGSGISYLISVLVLCLSSRKEEILLLENPEIHLHPKAQSLLCDFFCMIAKANRQLFIETHSDHIFNGIRVGIAMNAVAREDVALNFFSLDENYCTANTQIQIGTRGRILNPLADLFEQFEIDLDRMRGLDQPPKAAFFANQTPPRG